MDWMTRRFRLNQTQVMQIPTVKISDGKGGHIVINETDFDEKKDKIFVEPKKETVKEETEKPTKKADK